jgi:F420-dependent hydroxymycolic acid dehydrogenase
MPVLIGQFVVVGNEADARDAAGLWQFIPKAFKSYYNLPGPVEIQRTANAQVQIGQMTKEWPVSMDPAVHIAAVKELFDCGASIANIHSGQADQRTVIEFYGSHVLPKVHQGGMSHA